MNKHALLLWSVMVLIMTSCTNDDTKQNESANDNAVISTPASEQDLTSMLIGSWVQPNPINENEVQGFTLNADGSAQSINMATLKYRSWSYASNMLTLVAESIGNATSSVDTTVYQVTILTNNEMELKDGDYVDSYKKQ